MPRQSRQPSLVLLVILLAALGTGAAASALAGAAFTSNPSGASPANVELTGDVVMYTFTAIVIAGAALLLYRRLVGGAVPLPGEFAAVALVCILLLIIFVVVFRSVSTGGSLPTQATPPPSPSNATHQPNSTVSNQTSNLTVAPSPFWFNPPPWILFVAVAAIAGVVVAVVVPGLRALAAGRKLGTEDDAQRAAAGRARAVLAGAADAIGEGRDPREVIIALYAELLDRIEPMVGNLAPDTPEEIRTLHLERLGIAPARSKALTRLFEEARYSTHPLGPEAAARATEVIRSAEADLARVEVPS